MNCEGWNEVKLAEVLSPKGYIRGPFGSALRRGELKSSGMPVYEQQHAIYGNRDFRFFIDKNMYAKLKRFTVEPGDLIISCSGTIGKVSMISESDPKGIISQALLILRCNSNRIDRDYLYQYLSSEQGYQSITSRSSGSVQVNIAKRNIIENIPLLLPSLPEQKAISGTLECLDDKIELNNRINKTLEEITQVIFQNWFVDFEPFQDGEFNDSEFGRIPKGWTVKPLYDFAEYINGTSFKKDEYSQAGVPIVKIAELKNGITDSTEHFSGAKDEKYYIDNTDMLFSWSGNPETSIDIFIWTKGHAILNQHTFKVKTKGYDYSFIYLLLKHFKPEFTRIASTKQTTGLGHVTVADLKKIKFPYNEATIRSFCDIVEPLIEMYIENLIQNDQLSSIRGTLLPKLMSGEIRVPVDDSPCENK